MELVLRLHHTMRRQRRPYSIVYLPDPICWTEVPERVAALARQRGRWHRGLVHSLWLHRSILWERTSGSLRWIGMPYYVLFEMLAPVIELIAGAFLSVSAVLLEERSFGLYRSWGDFAMMIAIGVIENVTYRLLTLSFRLGAMVDILLGRGGWGKQERTGFERTVPAPVKT